MGAQAQLFPILGKTPGGGCAWVGGTKVWGRENRGFRGDKRQIPSIFHHFLHIKVIKNTCPITLEHIWDHYVTYGVG